MTGSIVVLTTFLLLQVLPQVLSEPSIQEKPRGEGIDLNALRELVPFVRSEALIETVWPLEGEVWKFDRIATVMREIQDTGAILASPGLSRYMRLALWQEWFGAEQAAREAFEKVAALYRDLVNARPPGQAVPIGFPEALYRSGELDEAEGTLRYLLRESRDSAWCVLLARVLLTRARLLLIPGESEEALIVPGERDELLRNHRAAPESVREAAALLHRAKAFLEEASTLAPLSVDLHLRRAMAAPRVAVLELLARDPPRTDAEIRDAQFPPLLFESLRTVLSLRSSDERVLALSAGMELVNLMSKAPRVEVTRLPPNAQAAIARAQDHLREKFPEERADLLDSISAAIPCLVVADHARATTEWESDEALEHALGRRAVTSGSVLLVLASRYEELLSSSLEEQKPLAASRARLLLSYAHFRAGDTWRAERLAQAALKQNDDEALAHLVLASLLLRRSERSILLPLGRRGFEQEREGRDLWETPPTLLNAMAAPALAASRFHLERAAAMGAERCDDLTFLSGIHCALSGDLKRARIALNELVPSLLFTRLMGSSEMEVWFQVWFPHSRRATKALELLEP